MGHKLLLVEDDESMAAYVIKGMSEEGFTIDHADNGRDGFFLASDGSYDAIILDRLLPAMDGMAVLAALRAARIETPVIILSAMATADDRVAGRVFLRDAAQGDERLRGDFGCLTELLNIKHLTGGYEVQDAEFPCSIYRLREEEVVADSCSQTSHRRAEIWPESNWLPLPLGFEVS